MLTVSWKYRLRQDISWHHMHTHTQLSLPLWRVLTLHLHIHFSLTFPFSLILSNRLILKCFHIWFNYLTSPLHLLSLSPSLFSQKSLWSTSSFSRCFPHASPAPPLSPSPIAFCAVIASLILSLSLPLSDLLWECYLYSNNPRRVERSRTERWGEFDLPKVGITSETRQNSAPLYSVYPYTTVPLSPRHITTMLFTLRRAAHF